jgi:hypothetical protein
MSKPLIHALSSVKHHGGSVADYLPLHEFMDSSKSVIADNRHRTLTHNSWFISFIVPKVFGETFLNSDGKTISSRDIAEEHVQEDYGNRFIPSAQDFLQEMEYVEWMTNGKGVPPSFAKIGNRKTITRHIDFD